MLSTSDFRKGMKLALDGELYVIVDFQHARTAQRRANVWTKLKHLKTGRVLEKTFSAGETFNDPEFTERAMQYLYNDGEAFNFMDSRSYEQTTLSTEQVGDSKWYLQENVEYKIMFFEGNPIAINMPSAVILKVIEAEPAIKGDSVSNLTKNVKVETGLTVRAPLFIKEGDSLKIDTTEGKYLERVS
ncbi:MAG: elongation factor P [candidate division Zixibacteria bacterium RBG_16_53_22]|nr:MAG: elongation factor P [candidate division Zixibacteria bacterium RBG_16_53_22]